MDSLLLAAALLTYEPRDWQAWPSMDEVRCIEVSAGEVYAAVPAGVYVFRRVGLRPERVLTGSDGLAGEVRLCAYWSARGRLIVATDSGIYEYIGATDRVNRLEPPAEARLLSLGTGDDGVYLDTDKGLFVKDRTGPGFSPAARLPDEMTWFGERDTTDPRDFTFLAPFYVTDRQLIQHDIALLRPGRRESRLYVAVREYGLLIYDTASGFPSDHLRYGPSGGRVRAITRSGDRLWFLTERGATSVDAQGTWEHRRTAVGDLPVPGQPLLSSDITELRRREGVNAVLGDTALTLVATEDNLYSVSPAGKATPLLPILTPVNGLARIAGVAYAATNYGLFAWDTAGLRQVEDPFGRVGFGVYSAATGRDAWFGTLGGILRLDAEGTWQHLTPPGIDLSRPVRVLAASDRFVFFGTDRGLAAHDPVANTWTDITQASGLPAAGIDALYADAGRLWIASGDLVTSLDISALTR